VHYNGRVSQYKKIMHGVPQGSVLGPLLFIIYINDFSKHMCPCKTILFADDTTLIYTEKQLSDLSDHTNIVLEMSKKWFCANKLKLNDDKTQNLYFGSGHSNSVLDSVTLLGIKLDNNLSWCCHIDMLVSRLSSILHLFRRLVSIANMDTLVSVYFALFHSRLNYGIILWGNSSDAIKIFRLQKKVIRVIAGAGYREHCRPLFKYYRIMPLPTLFIYNMLLEIHDISSGVEKQSDIHHYNTRRADNLRTRRFRLSKSQKNSLDYGLYNILPTSLKSLNFKQFKSRLKSQLLDYCFYSANEFITCFS
jgi:Reverse transcriptase (RNA-dependent DNA polymerase)